ncbi:AAC(3) family N-acetyltransferase [Colwellia hornerae]|uniref:Aminoglycoside N(3)-acetyltransferase n=1 Tax=Colwellia hornerae TaxID=89402 RepID=A0A5C6QI81_9GAMM|nr:AAC(3) family N-acetyltransferase [Colwellia hornerae]TWX52488.1 AAC(3) family N-acetyltransferase [Colwellia hornerae]TWX58317.1 AAC(3) family N-acetyltransferase [Colwellia hornerae]TWX68338.1 AAC(3) family N-acetyltransferase [Colwellia hornerae]
MKLLKRVLKLMFKHRSEYYIDMISRRLNRKKLKKSLINLGVKQGDIIFLQSSFSAMGHVSIGAHGVIDVFLEIIGEKGTLVMPSFSTAGNMEDYVAKNEVFDVCNTPSKSGYLTEIFRKYPRTLRSIHPTHSVCANGFHADEIIRDHESTLSPCGPNSPFDKMLNLQGKMIRIGTGAFTYYHFIQETLNFPHVFNNHTASLECINYKKERIIVKSKVYSKGLSSILFLTKDDYIHPSNFPLLYSGDREQYIKLEQPQFYDFLIDIRQQAIISGWFNKLTVNKCQYEISGIKQYVDCSLTLQSNLINEFKEKYEIENLSKIYKLGLYPRKK